MTELDLFRDAQHDTTLRKVAATHGGEWAGPCPFCGGRDRFHVQPAEQRWLCRGCTGGKWQSSREYYRRRGEYDLRQYDRLQRESPYAGRTPYRAYRGPARSAHSHEPAWRADPWPLVRTYEAHPQRFELWRRYKPLMPETIERMHLGVGVLPACSCHHERLVVPVLDGSMVVGLRGRRLACRCPQKWHQAAGTKLDLLPLYNAAAITPGSVVWIVENTVDALLVGDAAPPYVGVSTYSTSYWKDAWLWALKAALPRTIIVAYDQDLSGNGGGSRRMEFIRHYRERYSATPPHGAAFADLRVPAAPLPRIPTAAGPRLVRRLIAAGLDAILYDWGNAEEKTDLGDVLAAHRLSLQVRMALRMRGAGGESQLKLL